MNAAFPMERFPARYSNDICLCSASLSSLGSIGQKHTGLSRGRGVPIQPGQKWSASPQKPAEPAESRDIDKIKKSAFLRQYDRFVASPAGHKDEKRPFSADIDHFLKLSKKLELSAHRRRHPFQHLEGVVDVVRYRLPVVQFVERGRHSQIGDQAAYQTRAELLFDRRSSLQPNPRIGGHFVDGGEERFPSTPGFVVRKERAIDVIRSE